MAKDFKYVDFENTYTENNRDIDIETEGLIFEKTAIDGWPASQEDNGTIIANVITTLHGDTFTNWHFPEYKENSAAVESAREAEERQKEDFARYRERIGLQDIKAVRNEEASGSQEKSIFIKEDIPGPAGDAAASVITSVRGDTVVDFIDNSLRSNTTVLERIDDAVKKQHTKWQTAAFQSAETSLEEGKSLKSLADNYRSGRNYLLKPGEFEDDYIEKATQKVEMLMYDLGLSIHNVLSGMGYIESKLFEREDVMDFLTSRQSNQKMRTALHKAGVTDEEIVEMAIKKLNHLGEVHDEDIDTIQQGIDDAMDDIYQEKKATLSKNNPKKTR